MLAKTCGPKEKRMSLIGSVSLLGPTLPENCNCVLSEYPQYKKCSVFASLTVSVYRTISVVYKR